MEASFNLQFKSIIGTKRYYLISEAPPGPYPFRAGWEDGCDTGKAATGKVIIKLHINLLKMQNGLKVIGLIQNMKKVGKLRSGGVRDIMI